MKLCFIQIMESKIEKFLNLQLYFNVVEMKHAEYNNEETDEYWQIELLWLKHITYFRLFVPR